MEREAEVDEDYSIQKQEHRGIVKGLGEEADELRHVGVQLEVETCLTDHKCQLNHVCDWHKWVERLRLVHQSGRRRDKSDGAVAKRIEDSDHVD